MEAPGGAEAQFLEYTTPFGIPNCPGLCDEEPVQRAAECCCVRAKAWLN
jgi:hypothetical protein